MIEAWPWRLRAIRRTARASDCNHRATCCLRRINELADRADDLVDRKLPIEGRAADEEETVRSRITCEEIAIALVYLSIAVGAESERDAHDVGRVRHRIFRRWHDEIEVAGRDARISKMDGTHLPAGPAPELANHRHASEARRDCEIRW